MSVFESILLVFNTSNQIKLQNLYSVEWIGLDHVNKLMDRIGLDLVKWIHVQL